MRRMRVIAFATVALVSALSLVGCAKDAGTSGQGQPTAGKCAFAAAPSAPAAASSTSAGKAEKVDGRAMRVGLVYDVGGRGDASFNDAAGKGFDQAKAELGVTTVKEVSASATEANDAKESRLRQVASENYNPIIAVGFAYADAVKTVAAAYPNTRFAIVDDAGGGAPNVTGLTFAEHQGSFLAGVIAAYKSKSCHVGFIGGVQVPLIQKFEAGFVAGAKSAAPGIKIEKKYLTPAGDFTGFTDPVKGNEATQGVITAGADVVYHAAGASGKGVFSAVHAANVLAIGVDSDQYNQKEVAQDKDVIVSSMLKRVDVAVFSYIKAVARNDLSTLPKVFDLSVDGVGYATSGGKIDDIKSTLDAYKAAIVAGKITVPDTSGS